MTKIMEVKKTSPGLRLFTGSVLEAKDDLDDRHDRAYTNILALTEGN